MIAVEVSAATCAVDREAIWAEVKGLAYLCRLLGASQDRQYVPLLQDVAQQGGDGALRRHAKRGLDQLLGL